MKMRDSRWLTLMDEIGVPARSTAGVSEVGCFLSRLQSRPDYGNALDTRHLRYLRLHNPIQYASHGIGSTSTHVDLNLSIMLAKLFLLLRRKILVTEKDNASLCDQERQFVSLLRAQVLQLQTVNFGTDVSREIFDFACSFEERLLGRVDFLCSGSCIIVLPWLVPDVVGILKIKWTSWTVRVSIREVNVGPLKTSSRLFGKTQAVFLWLNHIFDRRVDSTGSHDGRF